MVEDSALLPILSFLRSTGIKWIQLEINVTKEPNEVAILLKKKKE